MIKIGIIEDQKEDMERLVSLIRSSDKNGEFEIHEYSDPLPLVENYSHDFDLLFLDIKMPMMDGMEAAKKIRSSILMS